MDGIVLPKNDGGPAVHGARDRDRDRDREDTVRPESPAESSVPGTLWTPGAQPAAGAPRQRSWLRAGFGLGVGLLAAYALGQALLDMAEVLSLVLLAAFLAVSLEPVVVALMRLRLRRGLAVAVVVLAAAVVATVFVLMIIPAVGTEMGQLSKAIPVWLEELHDHHSNLGRLEDRYHIVEKAKQQLSAGGLASKLASGLLSAGRMLLGLLGGTLIVLTLTVYFMVGMPKIKGFSLRLVAASRRSRAERLADRILAQVGRYMLANVATSVLAGAATSVWALAFGIPYAALLGFVVAVMDLVPIIGSTVGGAVVSLVALSVSWPAALATVGFYTGFRFAEDHLTTPLTMKYVTRLHPAATMLAVLAGGTLLGVIGALVAVPAAAAAGLVLDEVVFPRRDAA